MNDLNLKDRIELDLAISIKVKPFIEKSIGLKAGSSIWNYVDVYFTRNKIDLKGYGLCKENSNGDYKKSLYQKFASDELSKFQEAINFFKKLIVKKGFNFDFCKELSRITIAVSYEENKFKFDEKIPCNKDFEENNKVTNFSDRLVINIFYINELSVKIKEEYQQDF